MRRAISARTTVIGCPRIKSYLSNTHIHNKSQSPESVLAYRAGLSSGGETPSMNGPVSMPESRKGHDSDTAKNLVTLAPSMALSNGFPASNGVRLGPNRCVLKKPSRTELTRAAWLPQMRAAMLPGTYLRGLGKLMFMCLTHGILTHPSDNILRFQPYTTSCWTSTPTSAWLICPETSSLSSHHLTGRTIP